MFPRAWRLTRQRDVQKVYRLGASAATAHLFVRALPNRLGQARLTVVIGKRLNKRAAVRNRLKRLVRQAVMESYLKDSQSTVPVRPGTVGQDIIITVHREPPAPYTLAAIKPEVSQCFAKLRIA